MNVLTTLTSEPEIQRLGWVLIHFVWEGAGIALLLAVLLRVFIRATSHVRYALIATALCACAAMPLATWIALDSGTEVSASQLPSARVASSSSVQTDSFPTLLSDPRFPRAPAAHSLDRPEVIRAINLALPYLVSLWLIGVSFLAIRLMLGWTFMQRLSLSGQPLQEAAYLRRFQRLLKRMRVGSPVRLLQSTLIEVPIVIGWLRPTILIPASVLTGLTLDQLEAILAHELAHVRRYDYLVNLFQTVIETILFYHPAVWWISRKLREERENCCDDIALDVMPDRLVYVSALAQLEEKRAMPLMLSASGGSLLHRIRRIAGVHDMKASAWPLWILVVGILSLLYLANMTAKADKNVPSAHSVDLQSQLQKAVQKGDATAAQKLINQGADPKAVMKSGETLLFNAGSPEVAELLIACGVDPKVRDKHDITTLSSICLNERKSTAAIARVLLKHGADPNSRNGEIKTTPLMSALDGATVDVLVEYGADLKALDSAGDSVLYWATWKKVSAFEALIRHGAPFDAHTDGPTLLMLAAQCANLPVAKWLLDHGVDPNLKGTWVKGRSLQSTPLQTAVTGGRMAQSPGRDDEEGMVNLLLMHGAKVTNEMVSALDHGRPVLVKLFWDRGIRDISVLSYQINQGASVSEVQKLLDQGIPVDPPQDRQVTPLSVAAEMGRMDLVQLLVQRGADVNKAETFNPKYPRDRSTPLTTAASLGEDDIVEYLLRHGAQPEPEALFAAINNSFFIPIHGGRSKEQFERSVKLLIDAGTLKNVTSEEGGKMLSYAILTGGKGGNPVMLQMLLDVGLSPELPMPVEDGEKKMSVLSYCQDLYSNHPNDYRWSDKLKPLIDMLQKADPSSTTKTTRTEVPDKSSTAQQSQTPSTTRSSQANSPFMSGPFDAGNVTSLQLEGAKLTKDQILILQIKVASNPGDLPDRVRILGYYFIKRTSEAEAQKAAQPHILWIINNAPESPVAADPITGVNYRLDLPHYEEARDAWTEVLATHPSDLKVITNAASFFLLNDPERAEKLLQKGEKMEPQNPNWPMGLGQLYSLQALRSEGSTHRQSQALALQSYELGISLLSGADRFYALESVTKAALNAGDTNKAGQYAREFLQKAPQFSKNWNYGNAIYTGNSILGQIALSQRDVISAKAYLQAAGDSPGSPTLDSFGPDLTLARQLLSKGGKVAVSMFLSKIAKFWTGHQNEIRDWQKAIQDGQTTF
jgi:beta-lactamase regulating signal transducer with metallopeptidase domain/ankyrin repeat protein/tetratricopeptide (TPR) repeat protein